MEQKQKEVLKDALKTYEQIQKNIYQVQTEKYRWLELKSCSQSAICKWYKISPSVLSKSIAQGYASARITKILDDLTYRVRLARLALSGPDMDKFLNLEVSDG